MVEVVAEPATSLPENNQHEEETEDVDSIERLKWSLAGIKQLHPELLVEGAKFVVKEATGMNNLDMVC